MHDSLVDRTSREPDSIVISTAIANACAEAKGQDILALDVASISDVFSHLIIVSARSDRQAQGIANKALDALRSMDIEPLSVEGLEKGHWVVVDCGDVILHVFYGPMRQHYDLESMWNRGKEIAISQVHQSSPKARAGYEVRAA